MEIYLNRVDGLDDAVLSMYYSKRSIDRDYETEIRRVIRGCQNLTDPSKPLGALTGVTPEAADMLRKLFKWGTRHTTMLRFINLGFTVYGLHRGGQDDWDAHAKRFDNRIIRSSTRLAKFGRGEMSDWYKGRIIPTDTALALMGIDIPDELIGPDGNTYVRRPNGYVLKGQEDDKDALRGLYMLSIPSNFIYQIQLTEFAHVARERNETGGANPEVKQACESMIAQTLDALGGFIDRPTLLSITQ